MLFIFEQIWQQTSPIWHIKSNSLSSKLGLPVNDLPVQLCNRLGILQCYRTDTLCL